MSEFQNESRESNSIISEAAKYISFEINIVDNGSGIT